MKGHLLLALLLFIASINKINAQDAVLDSLAHVTDSIMPVADGLATKGKYTEAIQLLGDVMYDDNPRICNLYHKKLEISHKSKLGSSKFALQVLNENKCGPWSTEERCKAMEMVIIYCVSKDLEYFGDMVAYGDSVEMLCNRKPEVPGFAEKKAEGQKLTAEQDQKTQYDQLCSQAWTESGNGNFQNAFDLYAKAMKATDKHNSKIYAYNSQVTMLTELNLIDSAVRMQQRLPSKIKLTQNELCRNKMIVGDIYFNAGKFDKSLRQYSDAVAIADQEQKLTIYQNMSDCYYKLGNITEGRKYYIMAH